MYLLIPSLFWSAIVLFAFAQSPIAAFVFISEPQVIALGASSAQITIETQDAAGNPINGNTVCLEFTSSSPTGDFSTNENWTESFKTLILTLGTNQYRRNLFFKDASPGAKTIFAKAALRPENKTCPGMSPEEWNVQWTAAQQITVSDLDSESETPSSSAEASTSTAVVSPSQTSQPIAAVIIPSIKVVAGEDRTVIAGSLVEFKGNALDLKNEPLDNARFWWNFGDGNTAEGRAILHTFRIPGIYTVGLHVSSGQYAFSDYMTVSVVPNQLQIAGVILGEDGYIRIVNKGKTEIDFGSWILEDSLGKNFVVPVKTKIAPQAEVSFLNSVTGLFLSGGGSLSVKYPNGREAVYWSQTTQPLPSVPARATSPATYSIPAKTAVSADLPRPSEEHAEKADTAEEITPEAKEFASATTDTGFSGLFFGIALVISIAASLGFLLIKNFF